MKEALLDHLGEGGMETEIVKGPIGNLLSIGSLFELALQGLEAASEGVEIYAN